MLEVTITCVPFGIQERSELLYRLTISNDATGSPKVGNYQATLCDGIGKEVWRGRILKHRRKQGLFKLLVSTITKLEKEGGTPRVHAGKI